MGRADTETIIRLLRLTGEMLRLADEGDRVRRDTGCGVLYGTLRDAAYKLRRLAEEERRAHRERGTWDKDATQGSPVHGGNG